MKLRDFFHGDSPENLQQAGYNPESETGSEVRQLHQKLLELANRQSGHLDLEPHDRIEEPEPLTKEQKDTRKRMELVARNIIDSFNFDPKKESLTVVTDTGVIEAQPELVAAIWQELFQRTEISPKSKGNFRIRVLPETRRSAEDMGDYLLEEMEHQRNAPILILTSMSRSHSKETGAAIRSIADRSQLDAALADAKSKGNLQNLGDQLTDEQWEKLSQFSKANGCRLISITKGKNPHEILTKGAVEESVEAILERDNKVNELMKDVEKIHITSPDGTDLWLNLIEQTKGHESEDFSKPGSLGNYPIGEWACSPDWNGSDGVLVINGPIGGEHMLDQVKQYGPLKLKIESGEVVEINGQSISQNSGNPLIESVKAYLNSGNNDKNHAYRLAELGVGTNTKACEDKPDNDVGSSEGEKIYGTLHVAVGSNGSLGVPKNHPSFNAAKVHCDFILIGQISAECFKKDGSNFYLIKDGQPQGY
ncbi:MAG: hypothetical protein WCW26_01170 [Candidatus Buchananbacteria bacterium]